MAPLSGDPSQNDYLHGTNSEAFYFFGFLITANNGRSGEQRKRDHRHKKYDVTQMQNPALK